MNTGPFSQSTIYTEGVVPLTEQEKKSLDGTNLASRGLAAEEAAVAKKASRRRSYEERMELNRLKQEGKLPKKTRRGRKTVDTPSEMTSEGLVVTLDMDFLSEICQMTEACFNLVNNLSSGNPRLSSPSLGGIDLEEGYKLIHRMKERGFI